MRQPCRAVAKSVGDLSSSVKDGVDEAKPCGGAGAGLWERDRRPSCCRTKPRRYALSGVARSAASTTALADAGDGTCSCSHAADRLEQLPQELGFGCADDGLAAVAGLAARGVREKLHAAAVDGAARRRSASRASARSPTPAACKRSRWRLDAVPAAIDRGSGAGLASTTCSLDGGGIPLAWTLTGGNRNDVTQLLELLDRCHLSAARHRPTTTAGRATLIADRGYDHDKYRRLVCSAASSR